MKNDVHFKKKKLISTPLQQKTPTYEYFCIERPNLKKERLFYWIERIHIFQLNDGSHY